MDAISQMTFSNAFSSMKMFEFRLKFHWSLFPRVQLTIFQHWFRWWLGAVQATSHFLNQWWLVYRRIYASLGLNELIIMMWSLQNFSQILIMKIKSFENPLQISTMMLICFLHCWYFVRRILQSLIHQTTLHFPHKGPVMWSCEVSCVVNPNKHLKKQLRNQWFNTLRPRQNGLHFADDIFKYIFLNENDRIPIKMSLKFVPKGPINNILPLVQIMAWRRPGDKPLSEPMMVRLPTHICVTRPQWVKMPWCLCDVCCCHLIWFKTLYIFWQNIHKILLFPNESKIVYTEYIELKKNCIFFFFGRKWCIVILTCCLHMI